MRKNNHTGQSIQSLCTILMKRTIKNTACEKNLVYLQVLIRLSSTLITASSTPYLKMAHDNIIILLTFLLSWVFYQADITNVYSTTANTDTPTSYLFVCCVYNTIQSNPPALTPGYSEDTPNFCVLVNRNTCS
jgi:hypothetical protein